MTNFSFHILMIFVKIQNHKFSEYLNFLSIVIKNLDVLLKKVKRIYFLILNCTSMISGFFFLIVYLIKRQNSQFQVLYASIV